MAESNNEWQFELTPYLWASALEGDVEGPLTGPLGVDRPFSGELEQSFSDTLDSLDKAFMGVVEARKGDWLFAFEGIYFKTIDRASGRGPLGVSNSLDAEVTQQLYQGTIGRRVVDEKDLSLDVFGGARYTRLDTDFDVRLAGLSIPLGSKLSTSKDWVDPIVGGRLTSQITADWMLVAYADMGFSGVGSESTYQGYLGANWAIAEDYSLKMGYRYLYADYKDGDFRWDVSTEGPFLGLGIKY